MPKTTHEMSLNAFAFDAVKSGRKTIELRLYDEKRKKIKIGDIVRFSASDDKSQVINAEVEALHVYSSFEKLVADLPLSMFGRDTKEAVLEGVRRIYSAEKERELGVVGIKIRLF